jgi:putative membrane protein
MMVTDSDDLSRPSRQQLAIDRTNLANERTLLSYFRTSLGIIGLGLAILHFDTSPNAGIYGAVILFIAIVTGIFGLYRFYHFRKRIMSEKFLVNQESGRK